MAEQKQITENELFSQLVLETKDAQIKDALSQLAFTAARLRLMEMKFLGVSEELAALKARAKPPADEPKASTADALIRKAADAAVAGLNGKGKDSTNA